MSNPFPPKLIRKIVKKTGTPVYIYSKAGILRNLAAYRRAFAALDYILCYAMKANSNGSIARLLSGAGADVVSGGELYRALKAGFRPEKIIFSGVGKTADELAYALRSGILLINVESFEELRTLAAVAAGLRIKAPVSVRINPDIDPHTHKFITTGRLGTKFGVDFKEALKLYAFAAADKNLVARGLHFHLGSQIDSPKPYVLALSLVEKFILSLAGGGINLKYLDIGGGWGVKEGFEMLPPERLAKAAGSVLRRLPGMKLIIEPGRSLVASAGALAVSAIYRKKSGHVSYVITDGAMNDLLRPAFYGARHPVVPLEKRKGPVVTLDIAGPVCESGDFLAKNVKLPLPERGDILLLISAGAYGFSMSSNYNSRPRAPEALITGASSWKLIRKRETFRDLVAGEL
ncbi:MAG TPA: diaminopimelate decarboxylase [Elusimicrobia bacterium]|nr:diaminopimelate decarboxylase [Elusimicrobiota bacterium]